MLEHPYRRAGQPNTESDWCVVELIGDDETPFADQSGDVSRVGRETHRENHGWFGTAELGDELLTLLVEVEGVDVVSGTAGSNSVSPNTAFNGVGTAAAGRCESEIVVRWDVEGAGLSTGEVKVLVLVGGFPVEQVDGPARYLGDGSGEAIIDTLLQAADIERIKVGIERCVFFGGQQVRVSIDCKLLAEEIAHMAENDKDQVTEVGRDEDVERRCEVFLGVDRLLGVPLAMSFDFK
jgi:hypothetical protein